MDRQPAAAQAAFHCFRCQAPLSAGNRACPRCGQPFEAPVPAASAAPALPKRRGAGLWIAAGAAVVVLVLGFAGFAGYRAYQTILGTGLSGSFQERGGGQGRWSADPGLLAQLGPEQQISGPLGTYALRPPAGFTLTRVPMQANDGSSMIYVWSGPAAADNTASQFEVMLAGNGGAMTSQMTSAEDVEIGLLSMRRQHRSMVRSGVQSGTIHGLPFSRGYWHGVGARTGRTFHGLVYCEVAAPNLIMISGKDSEPASRVSLPLFDAAALSLHKL